MYSDLSLLRHTIPQYTDILHEYFVPRDALVPFLRDTAAAQDSRAVALRISVRVVHAEPILLDYARGDRYSVVLYLSQEVSAEGNRDMADLTHPGRPGARRRRNSTCPTNSTTPATTWPAPTRGSMSSSHSSAATTQTCGS